MGRFTNPRDLYFGEGARHEVKNLKGKKAIIVSGGSSMRRGGFLQDVEADLKEGGFEVKLFEGVESDPSIETVMKGAEAMREFEPDWIIAIGGGSPIDAAKAMWVFYEYPEESFDNIIQPFSFPELRQKAHFCAISSTSGTATEVTAFSVITDYAKGIKYPLADFNITPDVAIVDPELTYTMPAKLCAHTGMDALTHCMEAYVSTFASMFTDANALHGIREIVEWLPKSYAGDHEARQHMHEAQCIAGIAFSSGLLGIVHSMAHKTGAAFENGHIIHGAANAMYLGKVIQWNSKDPRAAERYAYVAKEILHLPGETNEELIAALETACAYDFVRQLPDGIYARTGELGHGLSEGQAQRIAVARAVLRGAPVLLLDEATSALDEATEQRMLENLMHSGRVQTCVLITHRAVTAERCPRRYTLRGTRLTEETAACAL